MGPAQGLSQLYCHLARIYSPTPLPSALPFTVGAPWCHEALARCPLANLAPFPCLLPLCAFTYFNLGRSPFSKFLKRHFSLSSSCPTHSPLLSFFFSTLNLHGSLNPKSESLANEKSGFLFFLEGRKSFKFKLSLKSF